MIRVTITRAELTFYNWPRTRRCRPVAAVLPAGTLLGVAVDVGEPVQAVLPTPSPLRHRRLGRVGHRRGRHQHGRRPRHRYWRMGLCCKRILGPTRRCNIIAQRLRCPGRHGSVRVLGSGRLRLRLGVSWRPGGSRCKLCWYTGRHSSICRGCIARLGLGRGHDGWSGR